MNRTYLNEYVCNTIKEARERKGMSGLELANIVGKTRAWVSFLEKNRYKTLSREDARKIEIALDITIPVYDSTDTDELLRIINELQEENRRLKELLMEKWKE